MTAPVTFPRGASIALCTVSEPAEPGLWQLSMHNLPDNRLTPDFLKLALIPALDYIELSFRKAWDAGQRQAALVLTGETGAHKFFSNGLQLELVPDCPRFWPDYYYAVLRRLLTFPMHTVAAVNGHSFAGGFCLMLACDQRIIKGERAWCCMNEIAFGAPIPAGMASVLQAKLSQPVVDKILLTGHRFVAQEALQSGIVDEIVPGTDGSQVVERALQVARERMQFSQSNVVQAMKETLYAKTIKDLYQDETMYSPIDKHDERLKTLLAAAATAKL
ncbi:hypothetical protein OIV83_002700 [Microbotryomycetes sp. JL201]|nr:hypothetical protein OIV83_002700 [Microbotryomycetes sp. JL201]